MKPGAFGWLTPEYFVTIVKAVEEGKINRRTGLELMKKYIFCDESVRQK